MNPCQSLAIVGSGPSAIYLLRHILQNSGVLQRSLATVTVIEKASILGVGMPYSPQMSDRHNMSNISSEEIPALVETFADWLRAQDSSTLLELGIGDLAIKDDAIYPRIALGRYLQSQYRLIVGKLGEQGIDVRERPGLEVIDVKDLPREKSVLVVTADGKEEAFHRVVLATGHRWPDQDCVPAGYFASPWPISKLLPRAGEKFDFAVGTLGASLSAFDVIASLAHRHGTFEQAPGGAMIYHPSPGTEEFKVVMHSAQGLLPHLQFDQVEAMREIYRHVRRRELLDLLDAEGFLRIDTYFDHVCRPHLIQAFERDRMPELVSKLSEPSFGLRDFVEEMTTRHDYANAFEGMRREMQEARRSVIGHRPIHWKELIDDLMYTLNFHAELMPAEDHLTLQEVVLPFQMNVIAAMPLSSAETLLALYDAGKLALEPGKAKVTGKDPHGGYTTGVIEDGEGEGAGTNYRMFVDCSGQKPLELDEYPFPGLVSTHTASRARVPFVDPEVAKSLDADKREHLLQREGEIMYHVGGVGVDGAYRLVARNGESSPRIHEISFPHTTGFRPYSYGLQACSDTSAIVVQAWLEELEKGHPVKADVADYTRVYDKIGEDHQK
ncbi:FAD/NAD(P)-binding protein [Luteolibacter sp. GHJ8]|uniref:FAD/NAD(P)-binding protein n=2 Tax=Luteolibacter rhizosphaerae TaxID=2989719 RepID=A0ABT3G7P8_9BACT|nr:FAD/NAD(P)-binding protein [Luteolibacter rhizosphaerae]